MSQSPPPTQSPEPSKESSHFADDANMFTNVWLPGIGSVACLIIGLVKFDILLLSLGILGAAGTYVMWCFATGTQNPKQSK